MSRRSCLIGVAIAVVLLANGVANKAIAGSNACEPVKAASAVPVCKPVKPLPPPEVCKPVKSCEGVDAHTNRVDLQDRIVRLVSHFKRHGAGQEVYYDAPQPAPFQAPPAPAPAPKSPAT